MMHDMMHDGSDLFGRSRSRTLLRCDPLLRISLQSSALKPIYASTLDRAHRLGSWARFDVVQPDGRSIFVQRQRSV
jgi:hypothetical protein